MSLEQSVLCVLNIRYTIIRKICQFQSISAQLKREVLSAVIKIISHVWNRVCIISVKIQTKRDK